MLVWVDAQLSPAIARWLSETFGVQAVAVRELGLRDAPDPEIFAAARATRALVLTKDSDFVTLLMRHGPPPQVIWLTCGNTSNAALKPILADAWPAVQKMVAEGEALVEVSDRGRARGPTPDA